MLKTAVALAAACALPCPAQTTDTPATELPELTHTSSRSERRADEVPASISVFKPAAGARDLRELLRQEVDLAVRAPTPRFTLAGSATGRAGNEGINIRGLEGNQVLMLVDGIRAPQAFSFGPFATGRAGLLNLEAAQAVEVLRGPASTQFGSDGLAGALALRTLRAADLLGPAKTFAARAQAGLDTADQGRSLNLATAWREGGWDVLLQAATRRSHALDNQGRNAVDGALRTTPDPQDRQRHSALGKLGLALSDTQRLELTVEGLRQQDEFQVLSARSATVLDLRADDHSRRSRTSLAWTLDDPNAPLVQQASLMAYRQTARVQQFAFEDRASTDRSRANRYDEQLSGVASQAQMNWGAHRLTVGLDASRNQVSALRDGLNPPAGESFPARPFPDTDYRLTGVFAQGEINLGDWQLVPALRHERFSLRPTQAGFATPVVALSDAAWTPRLAALWRAAPGLTPYAQWARGFKAPTPGQVNNGFSNPVQNYRSIGNPALQAEKADSRELGLRGDQAGWRWQVAAFSNRYDDFISQEQVAGTGTTADPRVFQSVNLAGARIRGVEARLSAPLGRDWRLGLAAASTRGDSEKAGQRSPLDSVEPTKLSASLRQQRGPWHWEARLLHARAKPADRVAAATPFLPPAATVLDLAAGWQISPVWQLQARLDNATDRRYWRWADVRGIAASSPVLDSYSASGRQVGLQLQAQL